MKTYELRLNKYVGGTVLLLSAALSFAGTPSSDDSAVAIIDGKPVLESELAAASQGQISNLRKQEYDIKRRALDELIDQKLLEGEARRRGVSVSDMTKKELDSKVGEPTDAEVEAFYLARPVQGRRFEELRDQMRTALKLAKRTAAREEFMSALRGRHPVEVFLDAPRTEVAIDPVRLKGPADAPVRIVEFSDFECPYCRNVEKTLQTVLAKYQGKVSLAYRDFPLTGIHPSAQRAAEASRCAADQGQFWPYHERLFVSQSLDVKALKENARDVGLDQVKFDLCLDSGRQREAVDRDAQQGRLAGVSATPAFFINGIPVSGALPAAAFEKIIDEELARKARTTTASR
jgi:protein-disulfide isomerase